MYFIYSVLLSIAFLILLPRFLFDALRHGKYVAGFRERLGKVKPIPIKPLRLSGSMQFQLGKLRLRAHWCES